MASTPRDVKILTQEEKDRCLDFAKRLVFGAYRRLTAARKTNLWSDAESFLTDCLDDAHAGWETGTPTESFPACDWFNERFEHYVPNTRKWEVKYENGDDPKYYRMLSAICRAALDVVDETSGAGVMGFTVGDIKGMFDEGIPPWLNNGEGWVAFMSDTKGPGVLMETLSDDTILVL